MSERQRLMCLLIKTVPLPFRTLKVIANKLLESGVTFATDNNAGHWIPVTERLPELESYIYSEDVMFFLAYDDIRIGYVNFETGRWKCRESRQIFDKEDVTHWMPLPEPPKEV